jgi:hypothetical protein
MLTDSNLDEHIRLAILDLMVVLYRQGITQVHIGGIMRILGVANDVAAEHDEERVILDEGFVQYVALAVQLAHAPVPDQTQLH